jgi:hypothetical protein
MLLKKNGEKMSVLFSETMLMKSKRVIENQWLVVSGECQKQ